MLNHPILAHDPIPASVSHYELCWDTGICGLPHNHQGNHVADHQISECNAIEICVLCQYRTRRKFARTANGTGILALIAQIQQESLPSIELPDPNWPIQTTCANCPVCHGEKFNRHERPDMIAEHFQLVILEEWYLRPNN